jgi:hypothetical protein
LGFVIANSTIIAAISYVISSFLLFFVVVSGFLLSSRWISGIVVDLFSSTGFHVFFLLLASSGSFCSSPANSSNAVARNQLLENEIARL